MEQNSRSNEKMNVTGFAEEFEKLDSEELSSVNGVLVRIIKEKRRSENVKLACSFRVGEKVRLKPGYQSRKPYDAEGTVKKINQTKLVVEFDGLLGSWNIPPSMLERSKGESAQRNGTRVRDGKGRLGVQA